MIRFSRAIFLAAALFATAALSAHAETINFGSFSGGYYPVPNGFGGLNYNNFYLVDSGSNPEFMPGFAGPEVAYNTYAFNASLTPVSGTFSLTSLELGGGEGGADVLISGTEANGDTLSFTEVVPGGVVLPVTLDWTDLTNVTFSTPGATFSSSGEYFAVDNLNVTATPEPSSLILLGSGLVAAAGAARRKLRKA